MVGNWLRGIDDATFKGKFVYYHHSITNEKPQKVLYVWWQIVMEKADDNTMMCVWRDMKDDGKLPVLPWWRLLFQAGDPVNLCEITIVDFIDAPRWLLLTIDDFDPILRHCVLNSMVTDIVVMGDALYYYQSTVWKVFVVVD